jgi:hypothetical protein
MCQCCILEWGVPRKLPCEQDRHDIENLPNLIKNLVSRSALLDLREPALEEEAIAAGIGNLFEHLP